ncbi:MAG: nucleoside hydrolase [Gemmataceae bacterium]|nr:nucleoside hydrolase [Gemmataceae bacterium]
MMKPLALMLCLLFPATVVAQTPRVPVIIDTDIGSDVDDAFALALALASPDLDIKAITTVGAQADDRAWIVCRFLIHGGHKPIPVAFGRGKQPDYPVDWQIQYRRHPAPIFNRTQRPEKVGAVELMYQKLKEGKLTIIALGPLTNVAQLLEQHPDAKSKIERIVVMGGSIQVGYSGKAPPEPEWNIKSDIGAARAVFTSGVPLTVVPLDATWNLALTRKHRECLFSAHTLLTFQVQTLYELWDKETPVLFDPAAVAAAIPIAPGISTTDSRITVDDQGMTICRRGDKPNVTLVSHIDKQKFLAWCVERVRAVGDKSLPAPPKNLSKLIVRRGFPAKVHVAEDYDTDIEKRWWMTGKAETKDVPPGGRRAQRGVLTQDFDDRQGNMKTSYRAVVFNPVPGPPMGPKTRLSFRYKLSGTDTMRVQLYSLTNGYHRYLSVNGLPQNEWREGTVDMTQMRRPDGTGGPLAENERIDDIQFYVDPRADLLIDDVVLYDEAAPGEKRPFPRRILFTGWFDTGKQGKEWPGDFEIVNHEKPRTWKAARSAMNPATKQPWLRVHLRGDRRLGAATELTFKYHLAGADQMRVELAHAKTHQVRREELKGLPRDRWSEATLRFNVMKAATEDVWADEIRFLLPAGATLVVDDVLLYVGSVAN